MAVVTTKGSTRLAITLKTGVDASGNDVKKTMSFAKVKVSAADENLFETAKAIEPLLRYPVTSIEKDDSYLLAEA